MKLSTSEVSLVTALYVISLHLASPVAAFSVISNTQTSLRSNNNICPSFLSVYYADEASDETEESDMGSVTGTIYGKLGVDEEKIALGIDPNEVLQWLGSKDDIVAKFMRDNKNMKEEKAVEEVEKFMMDAEMVNSFIAYEKKKADPNFIRKSAQEQALDPRTLGTYAAWITGGVGFAWFKNNVVEPKFASGEWQDISISLPKFGFGGASEVAESTAAQLFDLSGVDAGANIVDSVSTAM